MYSRQKRTVAKGIMKFNENSATLGGRKVSFHARRKSCEKINAPAIKATAEGVETGFRVWTSVSK